MLEQQYQLSSYNYEISSSAIAQEPLADRTQSKLLVVRRGQGVIKDCLFSDISQFLNKGDVLVLNNTKVINVRLLGKRIRIKDKTINKSERVEVLLVKEIAPKIWEALVKPGKRAQLGDIIVFPQEEENNIQAKVIDQTAYGGRILEFNTQEIIPWLKKIGKPPTPPYIKKELNDYNRYQTIYAKNYGAIAAPTAGFHFTQELLKQLEAKGVELIFITLHCGLGTFRPIKVEDIRQHKMLPEWVEISSDQADKINQAKAQGRRVIAVGTTVVRALESLATDVEAIITKAEKYELSLQPDKSKITPYKGEVNLYILPGYNFKIVDSLITNFHTPASTNLVLVSVFCGYQPLMNTYQHALANNYRFFSFGDACLFY